MSKLPIRKQLEDAEAKIKVYRKNIEEMQLHLDRIKEASANQIKHLNENVRVLADERKMQIQAKERINESIDDYVKINHPKDYDHFTSEVGYEVDASVFLPSELRFLKLIKSK